MKRLLLIAALVAPTWLYSCMPKTVVPTPASVIEQAHEAFPTPKMPDVPFILPNVQPKPAPKAPVVKRKPAYKAQVHAPWPLQEVEEIPEEVTLPCIFPFSLIPFCKAGSNS